MNKSTVNASTNLDFRSINPSTGELMQTYEPLDSNLIQEKLCNAIQMADTQRFASHPDKSEKLIKAAEILEKEADNFGKLIATEMGKPLRQGAAEVKKCAAVCRYYAENGKKFLSERKIEIKGSDNRVAFEPLGVIFSIMPWNFPFWQVFRFAAPAIMAGNTVLLKHAENVPQCANTIEKVFLDAGFDKGVLQNLFIAHEQAAEVIANKFIRGVTLTGSERAGSNVAALAGEHIKKMVLELGGSDPFIVLDDADIQRAVETGLNARMMNSGQSCIAAKRFILHEKIADDFLSQFSAAMKKLKIGNPLQDDPDIGPLARHDLCDTLERQVNDSVECGAELLFGGKKREGKGAFFEPGILINIPENAPAYSEELFGPVASVYTVPDEKSAVQLANDTPYGLGASVWSADPERALSLGRKLDTGSVFINSMVKSHPALPFGGVKYSGYGRELSEEGIKEFTNIKTYSVNK